MIVEYSPGSSPARPTGGRRLGRLIAGGVATLVVLGGGGAFAADNLAVRTVCEAVGTDLTGGNGAETTVPVAADDLHVAADRLRRYGHLLLFDRDLKTATGALADDLDRMMTLEESVDVRHPGPEAYGRIIVIAGSVNGHARDVQRACGLPVTGIFGG